MTITEALMKLAGDEDLVEIRREGPNAFTVTRIVETGDGFITGDVLGTVERPMAGFVLASEKYHGNKPRLLQVNNDLVLAAFNRDKVSKFLCHVYYQDGNGHARSEIYAKSPHEAFQKLLVEIKDDVDAEEESKPRTPHEQVTEIVIEAARPLNPGQHPDTPPLWYTVAHWKAVRKVVTEWEPQVTDEDEKVSEAVAAQAFAQAMCPPGMKAVVTGITEFGCTGTCVPTWNE